MTRARYNLSDYLGRITPWQSGRPKFVATVEKTLAPIADAADVVAGVPAQFDLDDAIGKQLDAVGLWVGRSRYVTVPVAQHWFSFGDANRGWGRGVWRQGYSDATALIGLDDETYRRLLHAVIAANHWDGTVPGAQSALDIFFVDPDTHVFIQDNARTAYPISWFSFGDETRGFNQANWYDPSKVIEPASEVAVDVSMTIGVSGKIPEPALLGLMASGAINIKPAGVRTNYAITTVNGAPLFGFGVQNEFVGGFGTGAWGATPDRVLSKA